MREHLPLLARWLEAVCSGNVNKVLSLYTSDAVLLGTFAEKLKQGQQLRGYFEKFLSRSDLCGQIDTFVAQKTKDSLVLSGTYTFRWLDTGGPVEAKARYSFVFVPVGRNWLILNHHSSAIPE
tara:strand:+ start:2254 stop:2622 length:369 start_codon:yes stop_codon:yes gene_type:complete